jgi:hypothetical protein
MGFLAPILLWGTLAAGIPVAIHLFFRSRYRTVPWAAMKFLLESVEQTSRRLRFQELLLLMLRVLVLAVLALALARPVLSSFREMALLGLFVFVQAFAIARFATSGRLGFLPKLAEFGVCQVGGLLLLGLMWLVAPGQGAIGGRGDAVDAVFVFDTSLSMGARDGGKTRLQRGRAEAQRIIDQLPPHSTVQIISCAGGGETLLGPRSPANLDQARGAIEELTTTDLGTDLTAGVARAAEVLERGQSPNKELYVFSDMQKQGWEKNAATLTQILGEIKEKASVILARCGTQAIKNVAVVGITPQSGVPRPGDRVSFAVLVRNTGAEALQDLKVTLSVDGEDKTLEPQLLPYIGPGETKAVALSTRIEKAGLRVLTARVGPDDLDGDNRLDQVVQVRDFVNVLIIDGDYNEREPEKASSFRLAHALSPTRDVDRGSFYFQPRVVPARLASPALLAKADICILTDVALEPIPGRPVEVLPDDFVAGLDPFVRQGHGLIIFAGDNVKADPYNRLLIRKHDVLPLPLGKTIKTAIGAPLLLNRNSFTLPAFQQFRDDKYYEDVSAIGAWQVIELIEPGRSAKDEPVRKDEQGSSVILRYDTGQPAIAARTIDAGEVLFISTASHFRLAYGADGKKLAPTWSMLPQVGRVFVPLVHTMVNYLMHHQSQAYNVTAGDVLHWYPADTGTRSYTLVHPSGKAVRLGQAQNKGKRLVVTADDLPRAGVYRLVAHQPRAGDEAESPGAKDSGIPIAAGPDLRETADLTSLSDAEIDARLGFVPVHLIADSGAEAMSAADRLNREWTGWLLVGVLVILVCEALLAWICGRAW